MERVPFRTWEYYQAAFEVLGDVFLRKVFGRSYTQICRYRRNPDFCADVEANPLDREMIIARALVNAGHQDVAIQMVAMLAEVVDCEVIRRPDSAPDKATVEEECLDDYPALLSFHEAVRKSSTDQHAAAFLLRCAKQELDETFARWKGELSD